MELQFSSKTWEKIPASDSIKRTQNPIRNWIESHISMVRPNPSKQLLVFTVGDPVVYPGFEPSSRCLQTFSESIDTVDQQTESDSNLQARQYLANLYSSEHSMLTEDDVFLQSGCSGALLAANLALADAGDTVLVPKPGFPLMVAVCEERGINIETYNLNPEKNWEIDLEDLEEKLKRSPKFLLVNNPSNPLGAVWIADHITEVLKLANKFKVPILADEVYEKMVFPNEIVNSFGKLSKGQPVIVASGYAKMGLAPGWRLGWVVCYGNPKLVAPLKRALGKVSKFTSCPTSLVQTKLPELFSEALAELQPRMEDIEKRVSLLTEELRDCPGIKVMSSKGAMYAVLRLDFKQFRDITSSSQFALKLLEEEHINTLPGSLFGDDSFIRIVSLADAEYYKDFGMRIKEFARRHIHVAEYHI